MTVTSANLGKWEEAVQAAREWLRKPESGSAWQRRDEAVKRIKDALKWPDFSFDRTGWVTFYAILELGRMRPIYRDRVFREESRLKAGLAHLIDEDITIHERLHSVLDPDGQFRVLGFGLNGISKILAVHNRLKWPVYNKPVESTLRYFGYVHPKKTGATGRYLSFAEKMGEFRDACGAQDVLALDAFFWYWYDTKLNKKKPVARIKRVKARASIASS